MLDIIQILICFNSLIYGRSFKPVERVLEIHERKGAEVLLEIDEKPERPTM